MIQKEILLNFLKIKLSFILEKPASIIEILQDPKLDEINIKNALFSLLELNQLELFKSEFTKRKNSINDPFIYLAYEANTNAEKSLENLLKLLTSKPNINEVRALIYILEKLIFKDHNYKLITKTHDEVIKNLEISEFNKLYLDSLITKVYLLEEKIK